MITPPTPEPELLPLLSPRFVYKTTAIVVLLVALTVTLSLCGRRLGEHLARAGHTSSRESYDIFIGQDHLRLGANVIRFENQRATSVAERVDLYLIWPGLEGYSDETRSLFNDVNRPESLIFLQIAQSTMSRDMSGRLEPIYSHLIEGPGEAFRDGLTLHRLRADAGYGDEVLLTAAVKGGPDYVVRCILPSTPDKATSGDCQRDIKVGKDLSVLYRFSSSHLDDWEHIDAAIRTFVEARLMNRSATGP